MGARTLRLATAAAEFALVFTAPVRSQATGTVCMDGSTSTMSGRGACTAHGGVNKAATKVEKREIKQEQKVSRDAAKTTPGAQVTVTCGDGTTSTAAGRGACARHGGVKAVKSAQVTAKATGAPVPTPGTAVPPGPMRRGSSRRAMTPDAGTTTPAAQTAAPAQNSSAPHAGVAGSGAKGGQQSGGCSRQVQRRAVFARSEPPRRVLPSRRRGAVDVALDWQTGSTAAYGLTVY